MEAFVASGSRPALVDLILGNQKELAVGRGAYGTRFKTFTGWTAQIIQHEIDHCEGVLI